MRVLSTLLNGRIRPETRFLMTLTANKIFPVWFRTSNEGFRLYKQSLGWGNSLFRLLRNKLRIPWCISYKWDYTMNADVSLSVWIEMYFIILGSRMVDGHFQQMLATGKVYGKGSRTTIKMYFTILGSRMVDGHFQHWEGVWEGIKNNHQSTTTVISTWWPRNATTPVVTLRCPTVRSMK